MIRSRDLHDLLELVACATARDEDTPFPLDVVLQLKGLLGADRAGYVEYHVGRPNLHQVETPSTAGSGPVNTSARNAA